MDLSGVGLLDFVAPSMATLMTILPCLMDSQGDQNCDSFCHCTFGFTFISSDFDHWLYSFLGYDCILGSHGVAGWVESWTGEDAGASGAKGGVGGSCQNAASTTHPCTPGYHQFPIQSLSLASISTLNYLESTWTSSYYY